MQKVHFFQKSRLRAVSSLLFLFFLLSGFSLTSSKSGGRSFPLPGNFEEVWNATVAILEEEKIPIAVMRKQDGYIQTATFPLYKKEYKAWAKAPTLSSQGFCALELGVVEKDPAMTIVGLKGYFRRKTGLSSRGFRSTDKSRGVFEGLLAKKIQERLVTAKFPKMKSIVLGCNLYYDDETLHYLVYEAEPSQLAYEQGLRNLDMILKIDGKEVTPVNLFDFFLNIDGEVLKKFTVLRRKETLELPVTIFFLNPESPRLGFRVARDPDSLRFKVTEVLKDSPASRAGLLPGDILLGQNGTALDNWKHYYRAVLAQKGNEVQNFKIERNGKILEKKIIPVAAVPSTPATL